MTPLLLFLSAFFHAVHDLIAHEKVTRWGKWFDPKLSWTYKYKNGDPKQGERFWLSTTALVFLTDGWHFTKFLMNSSWQLAIAINTDINYVNYLPECICLIIKFFLIKIFFNTVFETFYSYIWRKKM